MSEPVDIGSCFRCGKPAQYARFYEAGVGFFAVGDEPKTCPACEIEVTALPDAERALVFAAFATTNDPPSGKNLIDDALERSREIRTRARS